MVHVYFLLPSSTFFSDWDYVEMTAALEIFF